MLLFRGLLLLLDTLSIVGWTRPAAHTRSISVFHTVRGPAVSFDVCVVRLENVHLFRGRQALLSVGEAARDTHQVWCELSTAGLAHDHVCPWSCTLPARLVVRDSRDAFDVAVQFVNADTGEVPIVFRGSSQSKNRRAAPPRSIPPRLIRSIRRSHQLVTSFVIGRPNSRANEEHPLTVWRGETARDAAVRFVERHKLGPDYVSPLTANLRQAMLARKERRNQLKLMHGRRRRRIVLGASEAEIADPASFGHGKDWLLLSVNDLDVASPADWRAMFASPSSSSSSTTTTPTADIILAEHVFEHLSFEEALTAARLSHAHLHDGGVLRLAVPDSFAPYEQASSLKEDVAYGHKIRWTLASLQQLLAHAGFPNDNIVPLEFHSKAGFSYRRCFDPRDGFIKRSFAFDSRGAVSLIVDAVKPCHSATCNVATRKFELQSRYTPAALPAAVREVVRGEVALPLPVAKQVLLLDPTNPQALRALGKEFDEPAWLHMAAAVEEAAAGRVARDQQQQQHMTTQ